jgi:hypothetical protein
MDTTQKTPVEMRATKTVPMLKKRKREMKRMCPSPLVSNVKDPFGNAIGGDEDDEVKTLRQGE